MVGMGIGDRDGRDGEDRGKWDGDGDGGEWDGNEDGGEGIRGWG